tara:strand:- start:3938 stop:6007 length:2070 start_codon:yes stop_codon:yes gene_type:complete
MKNIFTLILSALLITPTCYAQKPTKVEKKLYKVARKQLANEDYRDAQKSYKHLVEMNATNETYHFEGGLSYYFSDVEREKGIPFFEASIQNSTEDTIPEIYYYLGRSYHLNGEFDKSKEAFNNFKPFIKTSSKDGQELMKKAIYFVKVNDIANKYLVNKNENIVTSNLGSKINSSFGEYAPVLKKDDNILLFTSRRETSNSNKLDKDLLPYENIYIAKKVNNTWVVLTDDKEIKKYMPNNLNSKKHDAGVIYSSDGKTLYTYKNDIIWKSVLEDGNWSKLVELDKNINTSKYNIPSISISDDGNTLFFVSNRKDGLGGKDIYKSIKTSEGNWGEAELLSESINSQLDEDSPYISSDGNTLYFSSKGHEGIGGYDIYKSKLVDGNWTAAENMGIPVNSASDDVYFIIDNAGINGFFASARSGGHGGMDIYDVCMDCPVIITNTINGILASLDNSPINDGEISIKKVDTGSLLGPIKTAEGKFKVVTEETGDHELIVEAPNYEKQITYLSLPKTTSETDVKIILSQFEKDAETYQVLNLSSNKLGINKSDTIKVDKVIASTDNDTSSRPTLGTYKEVYTYNSNKFNIEDAAFISLINKAIDNSSNHKIYIDIESSASKVPTTAFGSNNKLATSRGEKAKTIIMDYLKSKGVSSDNIVVNKINAIVSGPAYRGDFKNTSKYSEFQYVKITVK